MSLRITPSATWLRSLNQRQRKKLHLGEFQELGATIRLSFKEPLSEAQIEPLFNAFVDFIDPQQLMMAGFGGSLPLAKTDMFICRVGRGTLSQEDVTLLLAWLTARPEVSGAEAGGLVDAYYGFGD